MREILFRGKRTDNGEWAEGFYIVIGNPFTKDGLPMRHCIAVDKTCFYYEVDSATVGQFTGLYDRNGKRVFEGDALKFRYRDGTLKIRSAVIKYGSFNCSCCSGIYGWYSEPDDCIRDLDTEPVGTDDTGYEIVGNIHDNPELVKEETK